jgi:pantetheine-phosphate adenylyltransferase
MHHKDKKRIGVYAGSFDPLTNGHMSVIKQALQVVDELIIAVGVNPEKKSMFTTEERMAMISEATADLHGVGVRCFENMYLVDYVHECKASIMVRGIRSNKDYEYERGMHDINLQISDPSLVTIYFFPPPELTNISSSMVKGLVGPEHWQSVVKRYVPSCVMSRLESKYLEKHVNI